MRTAAQESWWAPSSASAPLHSFPNDLIQLLCLSTFCPDDFQVFILSPAQFPELHTQYIYLLIQHLHLSWICPKQLNFIPRFAVPPVFPPVFACSVMPPSLTVYSGQKLTSLPFQIPRPIHRNSCVLYLHDMPIWHFSPPAALVQATVMRPCMWGGPHTSLCGSTVTLPHSFSTLSRKIFLKYKTSFLC